MQVLFRCRYCFAECKANSARDRDSVSCRVCGKPQVLRYTDSHKIKNMVDQCVVCGRGDFYIRDDMHKALGLIYLLAGLSAGYFTYGTSVALGGLGFYWYFLRYPKLTICYHCYAKYRNCRPNPNHKEYDLQLVERMEQDIRNDRTLRDFR
jgi:hypothetical protein